MASLRGDLSASAPAPTADCTVKTDRLGDDGASPPPLALGLERIPDGLTRGWHVAVEMAEAREIGIRQSPFPCRYCIAEPMSSSISFATWCSVAVRLSFADAAPLPLLPLLRP